MGKREIIYLSLHCHHQNDSCIKMGSGESHFDVSLIVRDKVTRQCPQTTTFEEKGEIVDQTVNCGRKATLKMETMVVVFVFEERGCEWQSVVPDL